MNHWLERPELWVLAWLAASWLACSLLPIVRMYRRVQRARRELLSERFRAPRRSWLR